jgi:hypothetical protein
VNPDAVPGPTDACAALPPQAFCPIDPASIDPAGPTCTSDANCTGGKVCTKVCDTPSCGTFTRKCGSPRATCNSQMESIPAGAAEPCAELRECAEADAFGDAAVVVPNSTDPDPGIILQNPPQPQPTYALGPVCDAFGPPQQVQQTKLANPQPQGSDKWGASVSADTTQDMRYSRLPFGDAFFHAKGGAHFSVNAKVWGESVDVLAIDADGTVDQCGIELSGSTIVLDESVDLFDVGPGGSDATLRTECSSGVAGSQRRDALTSVRKAFIDAIRVKHHQVAVLNGATK